MLLAVVATVATGLALGHPALMAGSEVPAGRMVDTAFAVTADDLKPADCGSLTLNAVVIGADGGNASELIIGGPAADDLAGKGGDDCILGGGGDDVLVGRNGNDVCIGGPGNDAFRRGNQPPTCEVEIQ